MSRSGYTDDYDDTWALIRWRGAVAQAIRGARGQAFLRDLKAALEAMPEKRLIADSFVTTGGAYCTLGVIGAARGVELPNLNDADPDDVDPTEVRYDAARALGIADSLAAEIMYQNDEGGPYWNGQETPEQRWERMHKWVSRQIKEEP